jgi:hypothetical protein
MKKIYKTGIAFIAAIALLTSCSGDDAESTNNTPDGAYIWAKVDGVQFKTFTAQGLTSVYAERSGTGGETEFFVAGSDTNGNVIGVTTHGITGTGTYELNDLVAVMLYTEGATETTYDTNECEAAGGTLVVTHFDDTKIEGTFEFTGNNEDNCAEGKTITEGSFRAFFTAD